MHDLERGEGEQFQKLAGKTTRHLCQDAHATSNFKVTSMNEK